MIRILFFIFLICLPIQLVLISMGLGEILRYPGREPGIELFVINLFFFSIILLALWRLFDRSDCKRFKEIEFNRRQTKYIFLIFLSTCIYNLYIVSKFNTFGLLNHIQGEKGLGIAFKLSTTLVPSLYLFVMTAYKKNNLMLSTSTLVALLLSSINSTVMLTKAPLFSMVIIILFLAQTDVINKNVLKSTLVILFVFLMAVYIGREAVPTDNSFSILLFPFFRFPIIYEGTYILEHILKFNPLGGDILKVHEEVTSVIFGANSDFTGVAPGFLGFFWAYFGLLGIIPSIISLIFKILLSPSPLLKFKLFIYVIWCLELMPFFIDGNLSFITGTTNYKLFYILTFITISTFIADFYLISISAYKMGVKETANS